MNFVVHEPVLSLNLILKISADFQAPSQLGLLVWSTPLVRCVIVVNKLFFSCGEEVCLLLWVANLFQAMDVSDNVGVPCTCSCLFACSRLHYM